VSIYPFTAQSARPAPHEPQHTIAYHGDRMIKLARLACPYCLHGLHAHDVEVIGDDLRIVCASCHRDVVAIER
jgi:hypothetical protein